ncbi:hypothetical protein LF1_09020 [Rubripirellula obstinata]|uniref:Antitoxin ParD1 n=1 Tax=Rubripirellula obstinata TaxID=406547 RepID=A0A5B1CFV4_9BACT|nr:type II toxin-antitoxin system ParD family antitoxin [Rubripirellula obstinata]KAA1258383.1 hypothetical protein LF1_09020 [Rubripirellula obstinata]
MSQSLSPENEAYVDGQVAGGLFASRDEVIDAGVALLRKREALVQRLQESRRQLDNGEFVDFDDDSLSAHFEKLKAKAAARSQS